MNVKIYSTPTCPYCKLVKEFFQEQKTPFTEINVASNSEAAKEMVKISGQMGVPVVDMDGQIVVGWNKSALQEVIAQKQAKVKAAA